MVKAASNCGFFLTAATAAFGASVVGGIVGTKVAGANNGILDRPYDYCYPPEVPDDPQIRSYLNFCRTIQAEGPLQLLVENYGAFLAMVKCYAGSDDVLWTGIERLADHAVETRKPPGLARDMLQMFLFKPPPPRLRHFIGQLVDIARNEVR